MKKLLLALLLLPLTASAAISLTQSQTHKYTSVTAQTITFTSAVATGDVVGVFIASNNGSAAAPTSVADTNSDTLLTPIAWQCRAGDYCMGVYAFVVGTGAGTFSITVNSASMTYVAIVFDYAGVKTSTPVDSATTFATGTSGAPLSSSLTPTQTGDQQLAFLVGTSGMTLTSWNGGLIQQGAQTSGAPWGGYADQNLSSTAAVSASATVGASSTWAMAQLLLEPASGGATCTHAGITQAGAISVPTAGSTVVRLKNGSFGTVDCSTVNYKQPLLGNFGVN